MAGGKARPEPRREAPGGQGESRGAPLSPQTPSPEGTRRPFGADLRHRAPTAGGGRRAVPPPSHHAPLHAHITPPPHTLAVGTPVTAPGACLTAFSPIGDRDAQPSTTPWAASLSGATPPPPRSPQAGARRLRGAVSPAGSQRPAPPPFWCSAP